MITGIDFVSGSRLIARVAWKPFTKESLLKAVAAHVRVAA
jgi:hypothetical protein